MQLESNESKKERIAKVLEAHSGELFDKFSESLGVNIRAENYERLLLEKSVTDRSNNGVRLKIYGDEKESADIYIAIKNEIFQDFPHIEDTHEERLWFMLITFIPPNITKNEVDNVIMDLRSKAKHIKESTKNRFKREELELLIKGLKIPPHAMKICEDICTLYFSKCCTSQGLVPIEMHVFVDELLDFCENYLMSADDTLTLVRREKFSVTIENLEGGDILSNTQYNAMIAFLDCMIKEFSALQMKTTSTSTSTPNKSSNCNQSVSTSASVKEQNQRVSDTRLFFDVFCCASDIEHGNTSVKELLIGPRHLECQEALELFRYNLAMIRAFSELCDKIIERYRRTGKIVVIPAPACSTNLFAPKNIVSVSSTALEKERETQREREREREGRDDEKPVEVEVEDMTTSASVQDVEEKEKERERENGMCKSETINTSDVMIVSDNKNEKLNNDHTQEIIIINDTDKVSPVNMKKREREEKKQEETDAEAEKIDTVLLDTGRKVGRYNENGTCTQTQLEVALITAEDSDALAKWCDQNDNNIEEDTQLVEYMIIERGWTSFIRDEDNMSIFCLETQEQEVQSAVFNNYFMEDNNIRNICLPGQHYFIGEEKFAAFIRTQLKVHYNWDEADDYPKN